MLESEIIYTFLKKNNIHFFTGVPDSTLKDFCACITEKAPKKNHIITANEGGAIAIACGYYLSTEQIPLIYMQNSGIGNALNPLISLADPDVYSIPLLLMIGFRGEPGKKDEPQHKKQGKITMKLLDVLGITHKILPDTETSALQIIKNAIDTVKYKKKSFALVIRKGTFSPYPSSNKEKNESDVQREEAISQVSRIIEKNAIVVSTTGKISRELCEYRDKNKQNHTHDFLTIGSMGHCSHIALGIAITKPGKKVYCFDGDGSILMHMGSLAINGTQNLSNFKHILFNNGAHDSVGGQPTVGMSIDFPVIAKACGYKSVFRVKKINELNPALQQFIKAKGPSFLEIRVKKGSRKNLGRPSLTPAQMKKLFMNYIQEKEI